MYEQYIPEENTSYIAKIICTTVCRDTMTTMCAVLLSFSYARILYVDIIAMGNKANDSFVIHECTYRIAHFKDVPGEMFQM